MPFIPAAFAAIGSAIVSVGTAVVTSVSSAFAAVGSAFAGMSGSAVAAVGLHEAAHVAIAASLGSGLMASIGSTILNMGVQALLSYGLSALAGKPKLSQTSGASIQFKADINAGVPCVVGRTGVGGNIIAALTSFGDKNKYLHYRTILSLGPCDAIESFTANDTAVTFSGGAGTGGSYTGKMFQTTQLGTPSDPVLSVPTGSGSVPEITSAHKFTGFCAAHWALAFDSSVYTGGPPKPLWVIRGVPVYDPRLDSTYPGGSGTHRIDDETTWTYSTNPWLHALAYIIGRKQNGKRRFGVGAAAAYIDLPAFVEAANVAEDNGWIVGGLLNSKDNKWQTLLALAQAGGGAVVRVGPKFSCLINTQRVSIATVTGADVLGAVSIPGTNSRRNRINTVLFRYPSETHGWQMVSAAPVSIAAYVTEDGDTRTAPPLELGLVPNITQCAQLSAYAILDSRELGPIQLTLKPQWAGLKAGDVITMDEPEYGLNGQDLLVLTKSIDPTTGAVTIGCRTETAAKHATALGSTSTAPSSPTLTGIDSLNVPAPLAGNWSATGAAFVSGDGVSIPAIVVTGSCDDNVRAREVVIEYKPSDADSWAQYSMDAARSSYRKELTSGITSATYYDVAIRYRVNGVLGLPLYKTGILAGAFATGATADVTPDAIGWADITATSGGSSTTATTTTETFSGIDTVITLEVTWTGTANIKYSKNSGAWTAIPTGGIGISNGDTLAFQAIRTGGIGTSTGTVTVKNLTESPDTTLDTFNYSAEITGSDVTPDTIYWDPITGSGGGGWAYSGTPTFSGINTSISLLIGMDVFMFGYFTIEYSKNGGAWTAVSNFMTVSVNNGDTLQFRAQASAVSSALDITNVSDGGVLLNSFGLYFT